MSDIICRICGEPWDSYGVHQSLRLDGDGDMTVEEAGRLLRGQGCPCCKGKTKPNRYEDEFLTSLSESTDEDPETLLNNVE